MKQLIEFMVGQFIDEPASFEITEETNNSRTIYYVAVHEKDRGKIIGRKGRIIKAIRTVVNAAASKKNRRAAVELLE
ncbi:MAG: KH domain-containing protein [Elusimicrobia bacterium]|nr:KH domain-containing protein [Elusimicrobiota bacterium]MBD3412662.1 KH domain-containing protein [Elusimicrobiota bacterium]